MIFFGSKTRAIEKMSMGNAKEALAEDGEIRLIDVRNPEEYRSGHIPGSINLPLGSMGGIASVAPELGTRLFIYCLSGGRSARACSALASMGYTAITDLGGITGWTGPLEKGARV